MSFKLYDKAIEIKPTEILFYSNKMLALFKLKKYDDCLKTFEEGLKKYPESEKDPKKLVKLYFRKA